jgi:hypothetical protein
VTSPASLKRLQLRHWALVALAASGFTAVGKPGAGAVLLGGGVIGLSTLVNLVGLRTIVTRARPRLAIALLSVKLLAFLGLGWLVFAWDREHRPDPIGFAVGITCFPAAAVWEAMRARGS